MKGLRRWDTTIMPNEGTKNSRLTRGKSMDPKSIQAFEQEAFSFISQNAVAGLNDQSIPPTLQDDDVGVFSMEKYENEKEKKSNENQNSGCCCTVAPIVPRTITAQSKYSVCTYYVSFYALLSQKIT